VGARPSATSATSATSLYKSCSVRKPQGAFWLARDEHPPLRYFFSTMADASAPSDSGFDPPELTVLSCLVTLSILLILIQRWIKPIPKSIHNYNQTNSTNEPNQVRERENRNSRQRIRNDGNGNGNGNSNDYGNGNGNGNGNGWSSANLNDSTSSSSSSYFSLLLSFFSSLFIFIPLFLYLFFPSSLSPSLFFSPLLPSSPNFFSFLLQFCSGNIGLIACIMRIESVALLRQMKGLGGIGGGGRGSRFVSSSAVCFISQGLYGVIRHPFTVSWWLHLLSFSLYCPCYLLWFGCFVQMYQQHNENELEEKEMAIEFEQYEFYTKTVNRYVPCNLFGCWRRGTGGSGGLKRGGNSNSANSLLSHPRRRNVD